MKIFDYNKAKKLRIEKELPLSEIAKQLYMQLDDYARYERGITEPDSDFVNRLALILNCTADDLICSNVTVIDGFPFTREDVKKLEDVLTILSQLDQISPIYAKYLLNQLNDISLDARYAGICGITEEELTVNFEQEIQAMAKDNDLSYEECLCTLRKNYDGYHFHQDGEGVYNPFSLLNAFDKKEFGSYWFSTGTPTFLVDKLRKSRFDIKEVTKGTVYADAIALSDYRAENPDPIPLFYQTGYLTIKGYDRKYKSYELGYPNDEVKYGFLRSLTGIYLQEEEQTAL